MNWVGLPFRLLLVGLRRGLQLMLRLSHLELDRAVVLLLGPATGNSTADTLLRVGALTTMKKRFWTKRNHELENRQRGFIFPSSPTSTPNSNFSPRLRLRLHASLAPRRIDGRAR